MTDLLSFIARSKLGWVGGGENLRLTQKDHRPAIWTVPGGGVMAYYEKLLVPESEVQGSRAECTVGNGSSTLFALGRSPFYHHAFRLAFGLGSE